MADDILIKGARRIVGHPADVSDLRIQGGVITEVGSDLTASPGEEVVQADEMIVMPGMADTHTHLWEALFRGRVAEAWGLEYFTNIPPLGSWIHPEDMYTGVLAGSLELLSNGVTSVLDFCHAILTPEHADAALQGLRDAGIRALLCYDLSGRDPSSQGTLAPSEARFADVERVVSAASSDDLVRIGVAINTIDANNTDQIAREIEFSRSHGLHMTFHNNRGGELEALEHLDLLNNDILPAHCNYTTDADLEALARIGGTISTQPEAETYAGRRPYSMVGRAHRRGVGVALGVDVPALVNPAILTQMRLMYLFQRYLDGEHERAEGQVPVTRRPGVPTLEPADVVRFGTDVGVRSMGLGDVAGRLDPGLAADLVLIDPRPFGMAEAGAEAHLIMNATNGEVHSVMVGGRWRKRDHQLVDVDGEKLLRDRVASREAVLSRAGEIGAGPMTRSWWQWGEPND